MTCKTGHSTYHRFRFDLWFCNYAASGLRYVFCSLITAAFFAKLASIEGYSIALGGLILFKTSGGK